MIWSYLIVPRVIFLKSAFQLDRDTKEIRYYHPVPCSPPVPTLLHVCSEARQYGLRLYTPCIAPPNSLITPQNYYFNPDIDLFGVDKKSFLSIYSNTSRGHLSFAPDLAPETEDEEFHARLADLLAGLNVPADEEREGGCAARSVGTARRRSRDITPKKILLGSGYMMKHFRHFTARDADPKCLLDLFPRLSEIYIFWRERSYPLSSSPQLCRPIPRTDGTWEQYDSSIHRYCQFGTGPGVTPPERERIVGLKGIPDEERRWAKSEQLYGDVNANFRRFETGFVDSEGVGRELEFGYLEPVFGDEIEENKVKEGEVDFWV